MTKHHFRVLRAYAFDPSLSLQQDTFHINTIRYKLPWEKLQPGPIGEYIEVIDYDPTTDNFYDPVDLDDTMILMNDGISPSESNPKFHQQMVYAVSMNTIYNFEKALGRKVLWAEHISINKEKRGGDKRVWNYVQRLRIYPHALRQANAYYSPAKKALLFGYFTATPASLSMHMPGSLVFTCLSHDVISHEVTHAILDGMFGYYNYPTNPDVLAFHEAFSDIVALFQHFTFPDVLKHQIAKTRGDLNDQNLLGQLAQEFGAAIGGYGSLRDALGSVNEETGKWEAHEPSPYDYANTMQPHSRGSILVSAIFEAFLSIYHIRSRDLFRIATNGTGVLPEGEIHPDLVNRLADEAATAAEHVLNICIRALDYCPPVDITFGDYLRAIITADKDLVENDDKNYRLAFIEAFRMRGIYPDGIHIFSEESLRLPTLDISSEMPVENYDDEYYEPTGTDQSFSSGDGQSPAFDHETRKMLTIINTFVRKYANDVRFLSDREEIHRLTNAYIAGQYGDGMKKIYGLHRRLTGKFSGSKEFSRLTGLVFLNDFDFIDPVTSNRENRPVEALGIARNNSGAPKFQVTNLRHISRKGPDNVKIEQVVFSIIQKCGVIVKDGEQHDHFDPDIEQIPENGFIIRGGCTLIFDIGEELKLKYVVRKPLLDLEKAKRGIYEIDKKLVREQHHYQYQTMHEFSGELEQYFTSGDANAMTEPFAFLHQH